MRYIEEAIEIVNLTAKQAWRQLRSEEATDIGYAGFCKWLPKLAIDSEGGINEHALNVLRNYARVRNSNPCRTHQNGHAKTAALKAIARLPHISGSQLIDIVETYQALSKATVYRRAEKLLDRPFSAYDVYSKEQARTLIFGV